MPLETASHIASLNASNPASGDQLSGADDHLRLIKSVLLTDFANITGAVTATHTELNAAAASARNISDLSGNLTTAGTSTAYTLTTTSVFASLSAMNGKAVTFIPHATSGATPTLNVDGLGAVALKSWSGVSIPTGALVAGGRYTVTYANASTEFVVHGILNVFPSSAFSGGVTVQTGGLLVTAGGIVVTAGGLTVTAGATALGGALTVSSGGAAITGAISTTGNLTVTDKFSVAAATGNTNILGTLDLAGAFAINTNKLTVEGSTGNTATAGNLTAAGALAVTGVSSLTGALTANNAAGVTAKNTVKAFGYFTLSGTTVSFDSTKCFNVSGVVRNSTGVYTISFTNALADANYTVPFMCGVVVVPGSTLTRNTGSVVISTAVPEAGTTRDATYVHFMVLGL